MSVQLANSCVSYSPVAIGGIGGSGTRLVCSMLQDVGYFMGQDLNPAQDNLWFSLLFRRPEILLEPHASFERLYQLFKRRMMGSSALDQSELALLSAISQRTCIHFDNEWFQDRLNSWRNLDNTNAPAPNEPAFWGWKEPNTHVVLDSLLKTEPGLKYIHVIRNGLDMALSNNQNQLQFWGKALFEMDAEITPKASLQYWCAATKRIVELTSQLPSNQFYWLNFESFCERPEIEFTNLMAFLNVPVEEQMISAVRDKVRPLTTKGRYKTQKPSSFNAADVDYVKALGFDAW